MKAAMLNYEIFFMIKNVNKVFFSVIIFFLISVTTHGQKVNEPKGNAEWIKEYPPFRVAGNLYYVGTYDLACYFIATPDGNILINTGLASSAVQIKHNIEKLGFKFSDIKILLTTQAHYDHLGAMAAIKEQTGAKFMIDAADADVANTGGSSDYEMGKYGLTFKPIYANKLLHNNDTISLGGTSLVFLHHPGHTKGSCSFLFKVKDEQRSYTVLIANLPSIITDRRFAEVREYPDIANDYAYTLKAMKQIHFDLWLAAHASQFHLHEKYKPGDTYNPLAFADREGYDDALNDLQIKYEVKIKNEKK